MIACAACLNCAHDVEESIFRGWLYYGLLTTLCRVPAGGCSEPNDGVADTAQEAQPQFGCPATPPNSCPRKPAGQPRLDPIHSYMVR